MRQISHNAPFCSRNVHTCAHFCYKMVHCGTWQWCIGGCGSGELWNWSIRLPLLSVLCKLTMLAASDCFLRRQQCLRYHFLASYIIISVAWLGSLKQMLLLHKMLGIVLLAIIAGDLALRCATAYAHARSTCQAYICIRPSGTRDSGYMHINVRKAYRSTYTRHEWCIGCGKSVTTFHQWQIYASLNRVILGVDQIDSSMTLMADFVDDICKGIL